jgi:hypothetical protein
MATVKIMGSLKISIQKYANYNHVWVDNVGPNVVLLRRVIVHRKYTWGESWGYYRPGASYAPYFTSDQREPGTGSLIEREDATGVLKIDASGEYVEVAGRCSS